MSRHLLSYDDLSEIGEAKLGDWFLYTTKSGEKVYFRKEHDKDGCFWLKCYGTIPEELVCLEDAIVRNGSIGFSLISECIKVDFDYDKGFGTKDNPYLIVVCES